MTEVDSKLHWLHLGAAIAHGVQSAYAFGLTNGTYRNKGLFTVTNHVFRPDPSAIQQAPVRTVGTFRLGNMVALFPLLSMINHIWAVSDKRRYAAVLVSQSNPVRWIEYSISASLMFMVISLLSAQSDVKALTAQCLGNIALQFVGYMIERQLASGMRTEAIQLEVVGFVIFAAIWVPIMISFFTSVQGLEESVLEESVPEESVPEESVPEESVPEESVPKESVPEEFVPKESVPEEFVPKESVPKEPVPKESAHETSDPQELAQEKSVAREMAEKSSDPPESADESSDPPVSAAGSSEPPEESSALDSQTKVALLNERGAPPAVWSIIFVMTVLMLAFGLLSVLHVRGMKYRFVEMGYIILSLVAKTFLMNLTLFGVLFSVPEPDQKQNTSAY
jgi:hypothetical protein